MEVIGTRTLWLELEHNIASAWQRLWPLVSLEVKCYTGTLWKLWKMSGIKGHDIIYRSHFIIFYHHFLKSDLNHVLYFIFVLYFQYNYIFIILNFLIQVIIKLFFWIAFYSMPSPFLKFWLLPSPWGVKLTPIYFLFTFIL